MADFTIDYFELPSAAHASSRSFFEAAFGWTSVDYGAEYTEIRDAGILGGINSDLLDHSGSPLIGIRTHDIAAAEQAVTAAGGVVTRPTYGYPGGKRFFFREPGGNEMMVYQPAG